MLSYLIIHVPRPAAAAVAAAVDDDVDLGAGRQ